MSKTSASSTRTQTPDSNSRTMELRQVMRDIRRELSPYMTYEQETVEKAKKSENYYRVTIGKSRSISGSVWRDGGYFRANFPIPIWAKSVVPEKDGQRIIVIQGKGDKVPQDDEGNEQQTSYEVRFKMEDKSDFLSVIKPFFDKLVGVAKGKRGEGKAKEEAFDIVGVHLTEECSGFTNAVPDAFDFMGEGKGSYLAVKTSGTKGRQVVELVGPLPGMVESIDVRDGWVPILHLEADSRSDGLEKAVNHFRKNGYRVDENFGTILVTENKEEDENPSLRTTINAVISSTDMNLDEMENDTRRVIRKAQSLIKQKDASEKALYMVLKDLMNTSEMNQDDLDPTTASAFEKAQEALLAYKKKARSQ